MGFGGTLVGGLVKSFLPGGGAVVKAVDYLGGQVKQQTPLGKVLGKNLWPGGGPASMGAPQLPSLAPGSGGVVRSGTFSDVRSGSSTTAGGRRGWYLDSRGVWRKKGRRMNFANGRAISRAARRLKGAEKMFRRVLSITSPGKKGRIRPKFRKRA